MHTLLLYFLSNLYLTSLKIINTSLPLLAVLIGVLKKKWNKVSAMLFFNTRWHCISNMGISRSLQHSPSDIPKLCNVQKRLFLHLVSKWHLEDNSAQMLIIVHFFYTCLHVIIVSIFSFLLSHLGRWWSKS